MPSKGVRLGLSFAASSASLLISNLMSSLELSLAARWRAVTPSNAVAATTMLLKEAPPFPQTRSSQLNATVAGILSQLKLCLLWRGEVLRLRPPFLAQHIAM